ncbi:hypothetical protein ACR8HR_22370, partial [Salmonella enterica subsp. enterica serovar Paratyphi A]
YGFHVGVAVTSVATRPLGMVFVKCAALDESGNLLSTGIALFNNVQPGETAYEFADMTELKSAAHEFKCRLTNIKG